LECALSEANIGDYDFLNSPGGLEQKTKEIYSDHDYFAQKSPSNSDSGVNAEVSIPSKLMSFMSKSSSDNGLICSFWIPGLSSDLISIISGTKFD
jgi:hypothetical protein